MTQTSFLFRLDGSGDNDKFMALQLERHGVRRYAGTVMKIGLGWIPDFLQVTVDDATGEICLTLIELEATEIAARANCRKYLPVSSTAIFKAFVEYLDVVLAQCRATADPRLGAFQILRDGLEGQTSVMVRTACALRSSAVLLEDLPLLDGSDGSFVPPTFASTAPASVLAFEGVKRLSRGDLDGLRRTVRILHAVVVGKDHTGGTFKTWRNLRRKPLDMVLELQPERYPELCKLVSFKDQSGATVDCERVVNETRDLWNDALKDADPDLARRWIKDYHPIASAIAMSDDMESVFDQARKIVVGRK